MQMAGAGTGRSSSPCGACKFLRRKCSADCIFAPYFWAEQGGAARFGAIHKVFGASNVSKMLMQVGVDERRDAVLSIDYEAQARIKDPVYGCVAHILALQHQVASLQAQLLQVKAQLAQALHSNNLGCNNNAGNQFPVYTTGGTTAGVAATAAAYSVGSPQSFFDLFDEGMSLGKRERMKMKLPITRDDEGEHNYQYGTNNNINCSGSRRTDLGDLQAVALRMMRN